MAFVPVIPTSGLSGYRFVQKTYDTQKEKYNKSPEIQREIDYFEKNAGKANSTDALVNDRRLLAVVLGAFGLDDDIDKKAFIRKIINDGTLDRTDLANKFADPAYRDLAAFLGFGDLGGTLNLKKTRDEIIERYRTRQFEKAVGDVDVDVRLGLNFEREIKNIANSATVDTSGWFRVLGSRTLRRVVEGAYNLPDSFAKLDVDQQRKILEERTRTQFGSASPKVFLESKNIDTVVRKFIVSAQIENNQTSSSTRGSAALTLLSTGGLGNSALTNLIFSNN